jgi:hypothetical protein
MMMSVDLVSRVLIFGLLFLGFRPRSFGLPVTAVTLLPKAPLSLSGAPAVQITRFTICAVVNLRHLPTMVVALDVLPCLASLAEDRVPIVILKGTNAFDGVGLVLFWLDRVRDGAVGRRGVQRSGDRIRFRSRMRGCE